MAVGADGVRVGDFEVVAFVGFELVVDGHDVAVVLGDGQEVIERFSGFGRKVNVVGWCPDVDIVEDLRVERLGLRNGELVLELRVKAQSAKVGTESFSVEFIVEIRDVLFGAGGTRCDGQGVVDGEVCEFDKGVMRRELFLDVLDGGRIVVSEVVVAEVDREWRVVGE